MATFYFIQFQTTFQLPLLPAGRNFLGVPLRRDAPFGDGMTLATSAVVEALSKEATWSCTKGAQSIGNTGGRMYSVLPSIVRCPQKAEAKSPGGGVLRDATLKSIGTWSGSDAGLLLEKDSRDGEDRRSFKVNEPILILLVTAGLSICKSFPPPPR